MSSAGSPSSHSLSIVSVLELINELFSVVDAQAKFDVGTWQFHKERFLHQYIEDELKREIIPIYTIREIQPGSRIFGRGVIVHREKRLLAQFIFNVTSDGKIIIENSRIRGIQDISVQDANNGPLVDQIMEKGKGLIPLAIMVVEKAVEHYWNG